MTITLPIRTESELNKREHWAKKARRVKSQRNVTRTVLSQHRPPDLSDGSHVTVFMVRHYPRTPIRDSDNLAASTKAIRDEIAAWLGVDDSSEQVHWSLMQKKGSRYDVAVSVSHPESRGPSLEVYP